MIRIIGGNILTTRGDSNLFHFNFKNSFTDDDYSLKEGDSAIFSLRDAKSKELVLQKNLTSDGDLDIAAEETATLKAGLYLYDVEVTLVNGYRASTPALIFKIVEDVTYDSN